jgi:hypothetical protein
MIYQPIRPNYQLLVFTNFTVAFASKTSFGWFLSNFIKSVGSLASDFFHSVGFVNLVVVFDFHNSVLFCTLSNWPNKFEISLVLQTKKARCYTVRLVLVVDHAFALYWLFRISFVSPSRSQRFSRSLHQATASSR